MKANLTTQLGVVEWARWGRTVLTTALHERFNPRSDADFQDKLFPARDLVRMFLSAEFSGTLRRLHRLRKVIALESPRG